MDVDALTWSKPFCGVTHLSSNGFQVTVTDYGSLAEARLFGRESFVPIWEATFYAADDPEYLNAAKRTGREKLKAYIS